MVRPRRTSHRTVSNGVYMRRFTFQSSDPKTPERPVPSAEGRSDANGSVVTLDWLRFLVVTFEEKKNFSALTSP